MATLYGGLDDSVGRNLEIIGCIVGRTGERDEQPVLPARHARTWRRPQREAREKKRRRHDVKLQPKFARRPKRPWDIRRLHIAEAQNHPLKGRADRLDAHALVRLSARRVRSFDRKDDVLLM